ncbi:hypothetical protein ACFSSF_01925 [Dietzia aerolata]|uniref:hypothetical protein n=1 Tax=Dietzia aerolata TaxID=595984 RepID=UPI00363E1EE9
MKRRRRGPMIALFAGIAVILVVLGLVGLEFGLRNSIKDQMAQEITTSLGSPAQVELGATPSFCRTSTAPSAPCASPPTAPPRRALPGPPRQSTSGLKASDPRAM